MSEENFDFERKVLKRSRQIPVLVDFWAPWCAPCRALGPILESVAERFSDRLALVKINTEEHPDLAARYGVRGIPNVKLFVEGEAVEEFTGALPEEQIVQWIEKALPTPEAKKIREVERLLEEGDSESAEALLEEVLETRPADMKARLLLARSCLFRDPERVLSLLEPIKSGSEGAEMAEVVRVLARLLRLQQDSGALPASPVKELYLKAIEALSRQDFENALENFLQVVQKERSFDDDGARKAAIALFNWLGSDHPLTRKYRPKLAAALY
ncbi:MAG: thioredoxin [Methylothermaceae bacteria B42]|nr:MAG: thioredoxin [Methylothermaceae bacteria B42]HHJ40433.1 thioredoxin [Methylothermaceae bacterium]